MIDLWRKLNRNRNEYSFFSVVHGTYTKINHILGHKNLTIQCRKAEIVNASFSDHKAMKMMYNKIPWKDRAKINWKLSNLILKKEWVKQQIIETINNFIQENDNNETSY